MHYASFYSDSYSIRHSQLHCIEQRSSALTTIQCLWGHVTPNIRKFERRTPRSSVHAGFRIAKYQYYAQHSCTRQLMQFIMRMRKIPYVMNKGILRMRIMNCIAGA